PRSAGPNGDPRLLSRGGTSRDARRQRARDPPELPSFGGPQRGPASSISGGHFARRATTARSRPPRTPPRSARPTGARLTPERLVAAALAAPARPLAGPRHAPAVHR